MPSKNLDNQHSRWARVDTKLIELPVSDMETWAEQVDKQRAGKLKPKP